MFVIYILKHLHVIINYIFLPDTLNVIKTITLYSPLNIRTNIHPRNIKNEFALSELPNQNV